MKYIRICELGKVITGKTPSTDISENFNGEYPFITPTDIKTFEERYLPGTERTISELGKKSLKSNLLKKDTICFVSIGSTIGKMCLTSQDSFTNQQINSIIPFDGVDAKYLFYNLRYYRGYFQLIGGGTGSGKGIVKKSTFEKTKFYFEMDYDKQKLISNILSKYDSLIEINNKQIELLENIAESLYKEWFVKFRFSGYANCAIKVQSSRGWTYGEQENGQTIPFDWNFGELRQIAEFKRGKNITSSEMNEGVVPVIAAGIEPSGYHNQANVKGCSLTVSASGANAGYLAYHLEDIWAADCSYYKNDKNIWFVYNALKFLQPVISNMQVGSAQPHVYAKNINRISTIIPTNDLIEMYCDKVDPLYKEIKLLKEKNILLEKQRDSLLPRLMSGKLSVEGKEVI